MSGVLLAFDTATPATVVAAVRDGGPPTVRRHDPAAGERPGHAAQLLPLIRAALADLGALPADVTWLGVGVGPGSFTGLRIGVATGRGLALATGAPAVPVGTLHALAAARPEGTVLAVLDARRGEAFAAAWHDGEPVLAPVAVPPDRLAALARTHAPGGRAVGDGAVRFRSFLEPEGVQVAPDEAADHRVDGGVLCTLAAAGAAVSREALVPHYVRLPDVDVPR